MKLELIAVPVTDIDRAKNFYVTPDSTLTTIPPSVTKSKGRLIE